MKTITRVFVASLLAAPSTAAAQSPDTDIFVADMRVHGDSLVIGEPKNVTARRGYDNQPWFMPDGKALLYTAEHDGQMDIWRLDLATGRTSRVTSTPQNEYSPSLLPNGEMLVVRWANDMSDGHLWRYTAAGEPIGAVVGDVSRIGYYAHAGPDRFAVFVNDSVQSFMLSDRRTGQVTKLGQNLGGSAPRTMPDGGISFLARDSARTWWLTRLDPATRATRRIAPMLAGATQYAWLRDGRVLAARADTIFVLRPGANPKWTPVASFDRDGMRAISRVAVSDDGARIAFVSGSEQDRIGAFVDSIARAEIRRRPAAGLSIGVVKGGDTLVWKGYGKADLEQDVDATPETVYRIGSITKQFTSSAIMRLVEKGTISLDDPITKFLPDFPLQGHDVRMRHLLNHTSGIRSYTNIGPLFWEKSRQDLTDEQLLELFVKEPFDFDPGARYAYNNSGYYLLGVILSKLGGKPYGDYMAETMFGPLGLDQTLYCHEPTIVLHRAQGYALKDGKLVNDAPISMNTPGAAGALCSTIGDLAKWASLLESGRVVSPASYEAMTTPGMLDNGSKLSYGYGLGVGELAGHPKIAHGGGINGFVTQLSRYPADDLTIVVLANAESARPGNIETAIARQVLGIPPRVPKDLPMTAAERARYVGSYSLESIDTRVREVDGKLVMDGPEGPLTLLHEGNGVFLTREAQDVIVRFRMQGQTAMSFVIDYQGSRLTGERK